MPADNEFAARLARIEQRARTGEKAQYAPLPEHPDDRRKKPRRSPGRRLMTWVVLPGLAALVVAGVFARELSGVLPEPFVTAAGGITETLLSHLAPLAPETATAGAAAAAPGADSEVSRILLGQ